jgi:hypothetical protein
MGRFSNSRSLLGRDILRRLDGLSALSGCAAAGMWVAALHAIGCLVLMRGQGDTIVLVTFIMLLRWQLGLSWLSTHSSRSCLLTSVLQAGRSLITLRMCFLNHDVLSETWHDDLVPNLGR